jgi:hypothetical protein
MISGALDDPKFISKTNETKTAPALMLQECEDHVSRFLLRVRGRRHGRKQFARSEFDKRFSRDIFFNNFFVGTRANLESSQRGNAASHQASRNCL